MKQQRREKVPEINWGQMDEVSNVEYPEFLGREHGPVEDFAVDSEPVIFFDQLFTDELWDLLVTETNWYARQAGFFIISFIYIVINYTDTILIIRCRTM